MKPGTPANGLGGPLGREPTPEEILSGRAAPGVRPPTLEQTLFTEGFGFDFFQAVRVLERLDPQRVPVGRGGPPAVEAVRFRAHASLSFPPSAIYDVERPTAVLRVPVMTVAFMGLTGPSGTLPRHYTELLLRLEKESKGQEKRALREWFDLFNHRLISHFFRAWEKYRFFIPYQRGEYDRDEPDPFTRCLYSLVGLGERPLRRRLAVSVWEPEADPPREQPLARVDDLVLLRYSGFLAHRPRNALSLEALLRDYFRLPVAVRQFYGQWLRLDRENQSQLGGANALLGTSAVAGERVWDVEGKICLRLGPLTYAQFNEFLPDRAPAPARKAFFLLSHLVRLYVGPALDFAVQMVLRAEEVPACQLADGPAGGPRLGWNTWARSQPMTRDAGDAVFEGEDLRWLGPEPPASLAALGVL